MPLVIKSWASHDLRVPGPIVPPAREDRRRRFGEADKQQILEEAMWPDARLLIFRNRNWLFTFSWETDDWSALTPRASFI
jgi:hypothetical protein